MYKVYRMQDDGLDCVFIDITECDAKEFSQMLSESAEMIRALPEKSVKILTVVSAKTPIFTDTTGFLKYLHGNKPYVKASVVAITEPMRKAMFEGIISVSGRNIKVTSTVEEAKDFLRKIN